ncbi:hypothetical protein HMPREF0240_04126 [Clostridium sp. D5]|nr:hypothetical protein HMPREF0240_04126 [Clostridium sp. D5]
MRTGGLERSTAEHFFIRVIIVYALSEFETAVIRIGLISGQGILYYEQPFSSVQVYCLNFLDL